MEDAQKERLEDFSEPGLAQLPLVEDHDGSGEEGENSVTEVAEHDGEEEGEGGDGEETRVDLLVRRDAVRVDDGLEGLGEGRGAVESRRRLVRLELGEDRRNRGARRLLQDRRPSSAD